MGEHIPYEHPATPREYGINYGARRVRVFMDKTDWDHEVGEAAGGNKVYASVDDLRESEKCVDECGIVEVEITLVRVIHEDRFAQGMEVRMDQDATSERLDPKGDSAVGAADAP